MAKANQNFQLAVIALIVLIMALSVYTAFQETGILTDYAQPTETVGMAGEVTFTILPPPPATTGYIAYPQTTPGG
jgi:hypothetical protein